jgi:hypothetical protein
MLRLYYGGSEIPGWRTLLTESGVKDVALSYMGLRRRTQLKRPWRISDKYADDMNVFLDSGAFTVNTKPGKYSDGDLRDLSIAYTRFAVDNAADLEMISEFDVLALGRQYIEESRNQLLSYIPAEKLIVIWHPEYGIDELHHLAEQYRRVGIARTVLADRDLIPTIKGLVRDTGVMLHGIAMTKPDVLREVPFNTVSSTSWLSPAQYGDTIIWTGRELKRYPKAYKEQARKRHRTAINNAGFDAEAIANDDSKEVLRLSIWSWEQTVSDIRRHRDHEVVSGSPNRPDDVNAETGGGDVDTSEGETRNKPLVINQRNADEISVLPGLGLTESDEVYTDTDGVNKTRKINLVEIRSESQRICDTCFLASKCPAVKPGSNCAYNIPITVKTRDQFRALQEALIEMQSQRVLFMKVIEEREGGYVDGNLSAEMDRLQRMMKTKADMDAEGFQLTISARQNGSGQAGLIGRLFGEKASESARALPTPVAADDALREMGVVYDAEVIDAA